MEALQRMNWFQMASQLGDGPHNIVVASVNDYVVRLAVMTEPLFWHLHPESDELFVGIEGVLLLEMAGKRIELRAGDSFTVPQGTAHRTSPVGGRSVNLTFERANTTTVRTDASPSA